MSRDSDDEDLVRLLIDSRNRRILAILQDAGSLTLDELAERVVDQNTTVLSAAEYESEYKQTRLSLYHRNLPQLSDAGLLEYDPDEKVVARQACRTTANWVDIEQIDELLTQMQSHTSPENEVGVLTGRENFLEYGARLVTEADQELFCLYVTDDLITESCISCEKAAMERSVDIYIGSPDPSVREAVGDISRTRPSGNRNTTG